MKCTGELILSHSVKIASLTQAEYTELQFLHVIAM